MTTADPGAGRHVRPDAGPERVLGPDLEDAFVGFGAALRRHGMRVSTAEVVDAATCAAQPGILTEREHLRSALRASLVTRLQDVEVFESVFALWSALGALDPRGDGELGGGLDGAPGRSPGDGADDLEHLALVDGTQGASPIQHGSSGEADMREFFDPDALREGHNLDEDADIANLAAMTDEVSFSPSGASSQGAGMKVQLDVSRSQGVEAPGSLAPATGQSVDLDLDESQEDTLLAWLGAARGGSDREEVDDATLQALLDRLPEHLAEHLRKLSGLRRTTRHEDLVPTVLDAVSEQERDQLEEAIRRLARSLQGGLSQGQKPHPHGRVHPVRTIRRSLRYDGVPFNPVTTTRVRERPKVVVLADVSLSVRATARFTLHVVHGLQASFASVRSFAFVDELAEVTGLLQAHPIEHALGLVFGGGVLDSEGSSDYGSVFTQFVEEHASAVDRRTSVVVLGDGRSNGKDPGLEAFEEITRRARTTVWLSPEPSYSWGLGSCAMPQYSRLCDRVEVVRDLRALDQTSHAMAEAGTR